MKRTKRKKKVLKGCGKNIELVVGRDIGLEQILDLDGKTLAGFISRC